MINRITNKFINGEKASNSITGAAFLIAAMGLASRFFGLIRDRILASKFGAGDTLDAYYAAFKLPDMVFNLLILGALSAAFVPVFTSLISQDKKKEAWKLANSVLSVGVIALLLIASLSFIFAPQIVSLIAFGFEQEKQMLVVKLTRIMLASPIILGISGILGGILNSHKKFFFYSIAPIFYNFGIIIGALFLTERFGPIGLALGVVLGAFLHFLVQIPEAVRCGLKFRFEIDFKNDKLLKVGKLMIPRTMGLAVAQINFLVVTVLASTLASGSLAIFNFANNLQSVPLGVFGISFALAAFPTLSGHWAKGKKDEFVESFSKTFREIMFFIIPLSVMLIVFRAQIVRVVLGAGEFDWEDTILTFQALGIFSLSLFAQSLIPLLARSFYAFHNTKIPFFVGIFSEALNLGIALALIGKFGILGLVWAFSISTIANMLLLFVILYKKIGNLNESEIIQSAAKTIVATLFAAITAQTLKYAVSHIVDMQTFFGVFFQLTSALLGALVIFIVVGRAMKIEEMDYFIKSFRKKFLKPKVLLDEQRDEVGGI